MAQFTSTLEPSQYCTFQAGDVVGWYHEGRGVTDYDNRCPGGAETCPGPLLFHEGPAHTMAENYPLRLEQQAHREYSLRVTANYCLNCPTASGPGGVGR